MPMIPVQSRLKGLLKLVLILLIILGALGLAYVVFVSRGCVIEWLIGWLAGVIAWLLGWLSVQSPTIGRFRLINKSPGRVIRRAKVVANGDQEVFDEHLEPPLPPGEMIERHTPVPPEPCTKLELFVWHHLESEPPEFPEEAWERQGEFLEDFMAPQGVEEAIALFQGVESMWFKIWYFDGQQMVEYP